MHLRSDDRKTLLHPELGRIEVGCQALFTEDQSQALLVLTATPGSDDDANLRLLDAIGVGRFAEQG